tara:strand:- start:133 stop:417 length:285 start_codon:yes stop_codon:yes gene_type:complete
MTTVQRKEGYYIKLLRWFEDANDPYVPQYIDSGYFFPGPDIIYVKCSQANPLLMVRPQKHFRDINEYTLHKYNTWSRKNQQSTYTLKELMWGCT